MEPSRGEIAVDVVWRDAVNRLGGRVEQRLERAGPAAAQMGFEFGKGLLDRVAVRGIARQEEKPAVRGFDGGLRVGAFMDREIVPDHGLARDELGNQLLIDKGVQRWAIERAWQQHRRANPLQGDRGKIGHALPAPARHAIDQPFPARGTAPQRRQPQRCGGFIDKDERGRIELGDRGPKRGALRLILLAGDQGLFLSVIRSLAKRRDRLEELTRTPVAASHRSACSAKVASG